MIKTKCQMTIFHPSTKTSWTSIEARFTPDELVTLDKIALDTTAESLKVQTSDTITVYFPRKFLDECIISIIKKEQKD